MSILIARFFSRTIGRVEICVNGTLVRTIASSELISTPFGLQYNADRTRLSVTAADVVKAGVYTAGPNPVSLTTAITIAQVDAAVGGHDTLTGGDGDDIIEAWSTGTVAPTGAQ